MQPFSSERFFYTFQINSVLNVGEAAYSQIQKMKGQDDPEELNWKTNVREIFILNVVTKDTQ